MVVCFVWLQRQLRQWGAVGLLAATALPLSGCLESVAPDLVPRQPTLTLDFPVGDSAVNLNYLPITLAGKAHTYAGIRSLRLLVSRDGGSEEVLYNLVPTNGAVEATISSSAVPRGARRATIRVELIDAFGYRLERTLRVRLISGLPLSLGYVPNTPPPPTELTRGATVTLPLHALNTGALRELRVYEQIAESEPRLLRTVAGTAFTNPNNVPILWEFAYQYTAPTGVRPRQNVRVRFELVSVSGLTTSLTYPYFLLR